MTGNGGGNLGATLVEKLIAMGADRSCVRAGEIVSVSVDRLLINDYVGDLIFSTLEELGCKKIVAPENVYLVIDHNVPSFSVAAADKMVRFKEKADQYGITHMTELGKHGIGHQLMVEKFVRPLEIAVGTDSHATMYAGLGAFSCGVTASDAVSILTTGKTWIKVPETLRVRVTGKVPQGVTAKDISLCLLRIFPKEVYIYRAIEIVGETIDEMSLEGRLVIANMMAEAGVKCAVFEADEKSFAFAGAPVKECMKSDEDAPFVAEAELDVSGLEPMLSCPDSVDNVRPLSRVESEHVDQVFIGSCTNGRMEDLIQAARILKGHRVASGTRLLVTPASQQIALEAVKTGVMEILMNAGATILPSSCASCAGHGPGLIGKGECCVSTTNRNFKGRMGSMESRVYLGSAYTAAACAITGEITDPRKFLAGGEGVV
ncbi:aconitase/3-isopropylmalate dehydratase large subunit family protein [Enterocloster lavalensis]|uniref:aconitase/3-isopropylmalate dehydratase large subunit family protein n=1 Tax=Enterocloster lavalensis TaxID=460384 RepID=UPI0034A50B21